MPVYKIRNNDTGQIMSVQGDQPPSPDELDGLWQQYSQQHPPKSFGGFLGNLIPSALGVAGGVVNTFAHPLQTVNTLGSLATGTINKAEQVPVLGSLLKSATGGQAGQLGRNALFPQADQVTNAAANMYKQRYGGMQNIGNTLYSDPFGAAMDASTLMDGAGLVGDAGKIGSLQKIGQMSKYVNPVSSFPVAANLGGKATSVIGNNISDLGESMPMRGLRANPSQQRAFASATGGQLSDFLGQNNLTSDFLQQARDNLASLYPQYADAISKTGGTVPFATIQKQFNPLMQKWLGSTDKNLQAKGADIGDYLNAVQDKYGNNINLSDVLAERQQHDSFLPNNNPGTNMTPEQAQFHQNMRDGLKQVIDQATDGQTADIGHQINQWEHLHDIADKQQYLGKGTKPISITGSILGAGLGALGAYLGGPYGAAGGGFAGMLGGPVIDAVQSSPKVIGAESRALQGGGGALSKFGQTQSKISGAPQTNLLMQLLRNATMANNSQYQPSQ